MWFRSPCHRSVWFGGDSPSGASGANVFNIIVSEYEPSGLLTEERCVMPVGYDDGFESTELEILGERSALEKLLGVVDS